MSLCLSKYHAWRCMGACRYSSTIWNVSKYLYNTAYTTAHFFTCANIMSNQSFETYLEQKNVRIVAGAPRVTSDSTKSVLIRYWHSTQRSHFSMKGPALNWSEGPTHTPQHIINQKLINSQVRPEDVWGSESKVRRILNFGTRWTLAISLRLGWLCPSIPGSCRND